jgi:hypothetical protein
MINGKAFLKRNGFEKMETNHYANDMCGVVFLERSIAVADSYGSETFIPNDTYALIGYLTYRKFISKNYNA